MSILKNGGWRGIGEFVTIRKDFEHNGQRTQVCSFTKQLDQNGRRSRAYFEVRTEASVVGLPASVKSLKAALAAITQ